MDLPCQWYDRQMILVHLNHACDVTPPQSTVGGSSADQKNLDLHSYWDYLDDTPIELGLLV